MPSASNLIQEINNNILNGDYYRALKESKKLIAYEQRLLDLARSETTDAREASLSSAA